MGVVICPSFAYIANYAEVERKGRSKNVDQTHQGGRAWPKAGPWVSREEGVRALAFTECRGVEKKVGTLPMNYDFYLFKTLEV